MLIDIPVSICFDVDGGIPPHVRPARVFTMRYDTVDTDVRAKWCGSWPPPANAHWIEDEQGVLFDLLTSQVDRDIRVRAEKDPETYCADLDEGKALAARMAEDAAANGQFGVGA